MKKISGKYVDYQFILSHKYLTKEDMTKNFTVFLIRSNFNSDNNAIIEINLTKCRGNGWKSDAEINYFIASHVVEIAMISSYFDVNDYDNPVHSYLQDTNLYSLIPAFSQKILYKIQLNQLSLGDGIYFGSQGIQEDLEFYSIERSSSVMSALEVDYTFIQILITLDQKVNQYQRTVYSFLDLFGFIGGVFQIFELMGGFVVNIP